MCSLEPPITLHCPPGPAGGNLEGGTGRGAPGRLVGGAPPCGRRWATSLALLVASQVLRTYVRRHGLLRPLSPKPRGLWPVSDAPGSRRARLDVGPGHGAEWGPGAQGSGRAVRLGLARADRQLKDRAHPSKGQPGPGRRQGSPSRPARGQALQEPRELDRPLWTPVPGAAGQPLHAPSVCSASPGSTRAGEGPGCQRGRRGLPGQGLAAEPG